MNLAKPTDATHKVQMYRLLTAILNHNWLSSQLVFKGGTCAALRGWLDRFSVDLDFDLISKTTKNQAKTEILDIVKRLNFEIKDQSQHHLQFFLKYDSPPLTRNTLKLEINDQVSPHNRSELANLDELNRLALCQTQSTMVANKLIACLGRLKNTGKIAGRDFYDLHHFLSQGFAIDWLIVEERSGQSPQAYLTSLIHYLENDLTDEKLYEDINPLLPSNQIKSSVMHLKEELLWLLRGLKP